MADASLSYTDTSSSGGMRAIAAAASGMHRDGLDEVEMGNGEDRATTMMGLNLMAMHANSSNSSHLLIPWDKVCYNFLHLSPQCQRSEVCVTLVVQGLTPVNIAMWESLLILCHLLQGRDRLHRQVILFHP